MLETVCIKNPLNGLLSFMETHWLSHDRDNYYGQGKAIFLYTLQEYTYPFGLLSPTRSLTRLNAVLAGLIPPFLSLVGVVTGVAPRLLLLDDGLGVLGVVM